MVLPYKRRSSKFWNVWLWWLGCKLFWQTSLFLTTKRGCLFVVVYRLVTRDIFQCWLANLTKWFFDTCRLFQFCCGRLQFEVWILSWWMKRSNWWKPQLFGRKGVHLVHVIAFTWFEHFLSRNAKTSILGTRFCKDLIWIWQSQDTWPRLLCAGLVGVEVATMWVFFGEFVRDRVRFQDFPKFPFREIISGLGLIGQA